MPKKTEWIPERIHRFDPRYAYLKLQISRERIDVCLPKRIYRRRQGLVKITALTKRFTLDHYGSWEEVVIEAKKYRNEYVESVLGDQFMSGGFVARRTLSAANTSGHIGVTEVERGVFVVYWQQPVDPSEVESDCIILPRRQKSKRFKSPTESEAARKRTFKIACEYADEQRVIYSPNQEAMREFVLNDTAPENEDTIELSTLLNGGLAHA